MKCLCAGFVVMALAGVLILTAAPTWAVGPDGVTVNGNDANRSYDCAGGTAVVNGNHNTLQLENCTALTLNGNNNEIDTGAVSNITLMGSQNHITWPQGSKRPHVTNLGAGNTFGPAKAQAAAKEAPRAPKATGGGSASAPAASPFVVDLNRQNLRHDCGGAGAQVNGNENKLTLVACHTVKVLGNRNTLEADEALQIEVLGNENSITWTGPAGQEPQISDLGRENTIRRK